MTILKKLTLVICLMLSFSCASQDADVHIVLLGGQSNMAGHGNYEELDESVKKRIEKVAHRVLLSASNKAPRPLSYYTTNIKKYNFNKHFGPEIFIGLTLAEANPNQEYLLIKKGVGGTSLYGAWSTEWSKEKAEFAERGARQKLKLHQSHLSIIRQNLKRLKSEGKSYKILGMAWMQGEADTNKPETANAYEENLKQLIASYRKEMKIDNMPFIIGQVNILGRKFKEGPALVRQAMENVANNDKYVGIVKTTPKKPWDDYPKHTDNVHYQTEGQKRLGKAFVKALLELMK